MTALFAYKVELYLGATLGWVDITADVQGDLKITRGKSSEGARADRGRCGLRLDNLTGRYSPRNGSGSWYGLLGRNTPLRVSAGRAAGALVGRFYGEVPAWPPTWNGPGTVRYVTIEAVGVLQRLGQGEQPKRSPMRRTIRASGPVAYWPMEDGTAATQVASDISGHAPLTVTGTAPTFAAVTDYSWGTAAYQTIRFGTASVVDLKAGGALAATLPADVAAATATGWTAMVAALTDYATTPGDVVLLDVTTTGGTFVRWQLVQTESPYFGIQLFAYDAAGARTTVLQSPGLSQAFMQHDFSVWQDGANIQATFRTLYGGSVSQSGTVAGTLGGVVSVAVNTDGQTNPDTMPFGHLTIWPTTSLPTQMITTHADAYGETVYGPIYSWWREAATDRLARLCAEEGMPLSMPSVPAESVQRMGWQASGTFVELLDQAVDVDGGYLYEDRAALGLAYRTRWSIYNQTPTPITYTGQLALSPPFAPVDDLDEVRNDVTVKRTDGSSVRLVQTSGPLAAVAPPAGVGVFPTVPDLNLLGDDQLADQAGWRLHLGTVDRPRYPSLGVQLAAPEWQATPAALDALLAVDTGAVLEVTGLPAFAAGDVRTLVTGYTETISEYIWSVAFAGVPAQPWDVVDVDSDARVPADGSTLAAALAAPAVTVWEFTAASGLLGWSAIGGTVAISGGALLCTPNGAAGSVEARSPNTPVVAGSQYAGTATATCAVSRTVTPLLIWRNAVGTLLSSSPGTPVGVTAGVPAAFAVSAAAPVGATQAQLSLSMGGTPPVTNTLSVDVAQLAEQQTFLLASTPANGPWTTDPADFPQDVRVGEERVTVSAISGASSPQTATVSARAVNGVTAAWPAGTEVDVWRPAVAAL